jgi:hypothetical protein
MVANLTGEKRTLVANQVVYVDRVAIGVLYYIIKIAFKITTSNTDLEEIIGGSTNENTEGSWIKS